MLLVLKQGWCVASVSVLSIADRLRGWRTRQLRCVQQQQGNTTTANESMEREKGLIGPLTKEGVPRLCACVRVCF